MIEITTPRAPSGALPGKAAGTDPLRIALAAMRPDPWRTALAILTGSAALACAIALMGTSGWLISRAAQQPPVLYLMVAVVAVRTFGIGRGVLRYAERLVSHDVALRAVVNLRSTVYARLAAADPAVAADLRRGDLLARLGADVDALGDVVVRSLIPFATAGLTCLLSVTAMALVLPAAGWTLAAAVVVAGVVAPALAALAARRAVRDTCAARTAMSAQVLGLLEGLAELSVAGVVEARQERLARAESDLARSLDRAAVPASWAAALSSAATGAAVLGSLIVGVRAVESGRLAPVLLAVVVLVPLAVAEVVSGLPAAAIGLARARVAADRLSDLLHTPPARSDPAAIELRPDAAPDRALDPLLPTDRPGTHLRAVDVDCGRSSRPAVLRGVTLDLPPGRRIALVGPSGGGKSTLLLTLAGLLPPLDGQVLLTGHGSPSTRTGRRPIHLCADDAHIFTTSVRENLRAAAAESDDGELHRSLERAGLTDWLAGLPRGLDTVIVDPSGPGGNFAPDSHARPVSGGERRRLLLARALLSGADVLLVDEPAEHLDPGTADDLLGELLATGLTVVVVTHRLSPLAAVDEVLVLAGGVVRARGTHHALLGAEATYRQAWLSEQAIPQA